MLAENGLYYFEIFRPYSGYFFHALSSKEQGSLRLENIENCNKLSSSLNISDKWQYLNQTHSDGIFTASNKNNINQAPHANADAWILAEKNIVCAINIADCQAVILLDPIAKVAAAIHSGWRGSVQNIVSKTVKQMILDFGTKPENILAGISPSLGPCCAYFTNPFEELPQNLHAYILPDNHSIDFWAYTNHELQTMGLKPGNIETAKLCTKCHSDLFFSYRAERENPGRMAALISLL